MADLWSLFLLFLKTQLENSVAAKYRQPEEATEGFRREVFTLSRDLPPVSLKISCSVMVKERSD